MQPGDLLFVFGTLMKGGAADLSNNPSMMFLCHDRINGSLAEVGSGQLARPVLLGTDCPFHSDRPHVDGDLFRIRSNRIIYHLNAYAFYPSHSDRILTCTEGGRKAWAFVYKPEPEEPVPRTLSVLAAAVANLA